MLLRRLLSDCPIHRRIRLLFSLSSSLFRRPVVIGETAVLELRLHVVYDGGHLWSRTACHTDGLIGSTRLTVSTPADAQDDDEDDEEDSDHRQHKRQEDERLILCALTSIRLNDLLNSIHDFPQSGGETLTLLAVPIDSINTSGSHAPLYAA